MTTTTAIGNLDLTRSCTASELTTIQTQLPPDRCFGIRTKTCSIREATKCPIEHWLTNYLASRDSDFFLGLSIGCNKGDDAIDTARMASFNTTYDHTKWLNALAPELTSAKFACGKASDHFVASNANIHHKVRTIEMHCVEPMPQTAESLHDAASQLGLDTEHQFIITQAAVGLSTGTALFPEASQRLFGSAKTLAGAEDQSLASCEKNRKGCAEVPVYSMDDYVDKFVQAKDSPIHMLAIDVEGYDFDAMMGGQNTLSRTEYLEFEYNGIGNWIQQNLKDAIDMLDAKHEFTCYWTGNNKLWRITGCWQDYYGKFHDWSNIACVHRSKSKVLGEIMEQTFQDTLESMDPPYVVQKRSHTPLITMIIMMVASLWFVFRIMRVRMFVSRTGINKK